MKNFYLLVFFTLALFSCRKSENPNIPVASSHVFFKDQRQMIQTIETVIHQRYPTEKLQEITHVSYIDSKDKSYALVFYRSSRKAGNLLLEKQYDKGVLVSSTSSTCEGADCNCKVVTTISNNGDVKVNCSCSSCTLLTDQNTVVNP